jgi:hypothetical protein
MFQHLFFGDEGNMKVDKIIFVASGKSKEFPAELIKAVLSQASGGERGIVSFYNSLYLLSMLYNHLHSCFLRTVGPYLTRCS